MPSAEVILCADQVTALFGSTDAVKILLWIFHKTYVPQKGICPEGLRGVFQKQRYLTADNLRELAEWKMFGRAGLARRMSALIARNGNRVQDVTAQVVRAIEARSEPSKLVKLAAQLEGVRLSMASTILAAWSDDFPIVDPRSWKALNWITGQEYFARFRRDDYNSYDPYLQIVSQCARGLKVTPRELDKALFVVGRSRP